MQGFLLHSNSCVKETPTLNKRWSFKTSCHQYDTITFLSHVSGAREFLSFKFPTGLYFLACGQKEDSGARYIFFSFSSKPCNEDVCHLATWGQCWETEEYTGQECIADCCHPSHKPLWPWQVYMPSSSWQSRRLGWSSLSDVSPTHWI